MSVINEFGQPIGKGLQGWTKPEFPTSEGLSGRTVDLVSLDASTQATGLFKAFEKAEDSLWTYLPFGPFANPDQLATTLGAFCAFPDWQPYCITVDGVPLGFASYLRIDQVAGAVEIGAIVLSPALQRTTAATEALFLMIKHCFDLGYRRCEWKCDDLNAPSRSAAERLGFQYEGTFRQATHYKGRNRDTAWYALTDLDWVKLEVAFTQWLSPQNFDSEGSQIRPLQR